ncbi:hypothetical protein NDU88_006338 [Pleurodeles waltl]|uniref:Uncharacterized protein n=1 Tax=Pleurodeles waltl TaxID=8319 RepID=A0AAV7VPI6_PLEWA|nr:hypothetical protein NDU88_006338 [Pleurodeles waltl]
MHRGPLGLPLPPQLFSSSSPHWPLQVTSSRSGEGSLGKLNGAQPLPIRPAHAATRSCGELQEFPLLFRCETTSAQLSLTRLGLSLTMPFYPYFTPGSYQDQSNLAGRIYLLEDLASFNAV